MEFHVAVEFVEGPEAKERVRVLVGAGDRRQQWADRHVGVSGLFTGTERRPTTTKRQPARRPG